MVHLKSPYEIERLRESAQLVSKTLTEVAKMIGPGVSTQALDQMAETFIRDHGAEPAFKGYRIGKHVFPSVLCVSLNEEVVHGIPSDYVLQAGDVVSVDCGVLLNGYYGDSAYTFAIGELSPENLHLLQTTYEALYRGIEQAVAGRYVGDISHAIENHCTPHGYGIVRDLVGHGIGRSLHEDPQVPNFGRPGRGKKLREGMTFCIEPMINRGTAEVTVDDDGWTVRAADGLPSAHYEHMVVVRRGEAEILTTFENIEGIVETPYKPMEMYG